MNIRFIQKKNENLNYISFWGGRVKYDFEINCNHKDCRNCKQLEICEKELKINLIKQFSDKEWEKYNG